MTDGLRAGLTALRDEWRESSAHHPDCVPDEDCVGCAADELTALLADPAPEAASIESLIERSSLGTPEAKALRAIVSDEQAARIVARFKELAADLPVATGVTTEDETALCCGSGMCAAPKHIHGCYADIDGSACDDPDDHPAPAPVVSAGDEGRVSSTRLVLRRLLIAEYGDQGWDELGSLRRIAKEVEDHFAARVAEAGSRALREAADAWPRDIYRLPESTTVDDWLRERARGLGGAS